MAKKAAVSDWSDAIKHLRKDKVLRKIIDRVGPCELSPKRDYFLALVNSIIGQQVSTAAARAISRKFCVHFPRQCPKPHAVREFLLNADEEKLKTTGLSRAKRAYLADLAHHFHDNLVPHRRFSKMTDEEIIEALVPIKGIGRWTAEMLLIFALNRPDVWPVDDLGIREGVYHFFKLKERPTPKSLRDFADKWRPYRSVASWYLWKGRDTKPPAKPPAGKKAKSVM